MRKSKQEILVSACVRVDWRSQRRDGNERYGEAQTCMAHEPTSLNVASLRIASKTKSKSLHTFRTVTVLMSGSSKSQAHGNDAGDGGVAGSGKGIRHRRN